MKASSQGYDTHHTGTMIHWQWTEKLTLERCVRYLRWMIKITKRGKYKWVTGPRESCLYLAGGVAVLRQITRELPRSFPMTQTLHASLSALSDTTQNENKQAGLTAVRQVQITFMRMRILFFYARSRISTNLHFKIWPLPGGQLINTHYWQLRSHHCSDDSWRRAVGGGGGGSSGILRNQQQCVRYIMWVSGT